MAGPAIILLLLFMVWPFVHGIQLSRTNQRFDSRAAQNVGGKNYDRLLSVSLIRLPDVPDSVPDSASAGWYKSKTGDLIFRWRPNTLDEVGLEKWKAYEIARTFHLGNRYYAVIAKDSLFWQALLNNFRFAIVVVPLQTLLALLLAILVNQKLPAINIFRTIYFSPVVTSIVVIAVVWKFLYNPDFGLINEMLEFVSAGKIGPYKWLLSSSQAMNAIIIMSIWQGVGFQMIVFLAGLQDIPEDLYEASGIDGASLWQKFRYITLPMLRNTTIFVVLATTVLAFRLFDQVNVMTPDGGPEESTATMVWYAIRIGWRQNEVGYASAISIVFVAIVLVISLVQRLTVKSERAMDY
ncbi:MAG: sugar ABC transporter permease [Anaerolineae bacterium]|nr:sugar ABC transporter permease [Anaerolineae bacterium]